MVEVRDKRRLAAILVADIVGYSRLMEADESGTLAQLKALRKELIDPKVEEYSGRVVKTTGDGILIEFASVIDAVQMAVEVQRGVARRNEGVPEDHRMVFRVGINQGDIIVDGDDIHGDGVNIAARLEQLSQPGGICISRVVRDLVRDKLSYKLDDLGEQKLKNISRPVRAFDVLFDEAPTSPARPSKPKATKSKRSWLVPGLAAAVLLIAVIGGGAFWWQPWVTRVEAANVANMAFPLPEKPSIVVLPFNNLSGDPGQEFLVDGFTEDITTALSQLPRLFVIARNSAMTYKGRAVKVQEVAEDLGVQFVLEGSVQRDGDRLRVNAQLIDAVLGRHIWAGRFDRDATELFDVRDEITLNLVSNIGAELGAGERDRLTRRETQSLDAWLLFKQGFSAWFTLAEENIFRGMELLEQALVIDPDFHTARASLAGAYRFAGTAQFLDQDEAFAKAEELLAVVFAADPDNDDAHQELALLRRHQSRIDEAIEASRRAVEINPNNSVAHARLGFILLSVSTDEAAQELNTALRLSPFSDHWVHISFGEAVRLTGRNSDALAILDKIVRDEPSPFNVAWAQYDRAMALDALGREDDARQAVAEMTKAFPDWTVTYHQGLLAGSGDPKRASHEVETLRRLGLPE